MWFPSCPAALAMEDAITLARDSAPDWPCEGHAY